MFYLDLFRKLEQHRVRYLLVGGLAMNLHGVPRMTMDIDIILILDDDNLDAFFKVAKELALTPSIPVSLNDLRDEQLRNSWISKKNLIVLPLRAKDPHSPTLDILLSHNLEMNQALANANRVKLGETTVTLASVSDMIKLKQRAGRKQDISDIEQLQKIFDET